MLYAIVVVLLLIADQGLKYWVTVHVALNEGRHVLIPHVLDIMNIHNYGIAFSWLQNVPSWVFAIIAVAFAVVVVLALKRGMIHGKFGRWMAVIALAGAIGNLIDRVLSGYVVDMLAFAFWKSFPVFNIADACLVVGGIAFFLYAIFHKEEDETEAKKPKSDSKKPALGAVLAKKRAELQKNVSEKQHAHAKARRTAAQDKPERKEKPAAPAASEHAAASDDPFAAWDRAVSERDARAKADAERKAAREAKIRAEREQKRAAEAAKAKAEAEKTEPEKAPAPKPPVDDAPTRKVAAQKIDEMASKLTQKKPEPPAEKEVSYDLEDILREFADL